MTALSIVQVVCYEVGITPPASLTTVGDLASAQMLALVNSSLRGVSRNKDWPVLQVDYTFPTVNGTAQYTLPADWRSLVTDTLYNASSYYKLKGGLTTAQLMQDKNMLLSAVSRTEFRIHGNPLKIELTPTPTVADNLTLVYRTKNFAVSAGAVAKPIFTADTDTAVVDEDLLLLDFRWRLKAAKGLDYSEDRNEFDATHDSMFAKAIGLPTIIIGNRSALAPITDGYVRENGFG